MEPSFYYLFFFLFLLVSFVSTPVTATDIPPQPVQGASMVSRTENQCLKVVSDSLVCVRNRCTVALFKMFTTRQCNVFHDRNGGIDRMARNWHK